MKTGAILLSSIASLVAGIAGDGEGLTEHRRAAADSRAAGRQALFPSETWIFPSFAFRGGATIPWTERVDAPPKAYPTLLITAYYREDGKDGWLITERFYRASLNGVEGIGGGIARGLDVEGDQIVMLSISGTETT